MGRQRVALAGLLGAALSLASVSSGCDSAHANGEPCLKASDCESNFCRGGVCVAEPKNTLATSASVSSSASTGGTGGVGGAEGGMGGAEGGSGGAAGGMGGAGGTAGAGG